MKLFFLLVALAALNIPGPCAYDPHPELDGAACQDFSDCPAGVECVNGVCSAGGSVDACGACPGGTECRGGRCEPFGALGCNDDGDCGFGQRCDGAGVCVDDNAGNPCDLLGNNGCSPNQDCVPSGPNPLAPQGVCAAAATAPLFSGDVCQPSTAENPCARDAVCAVTGPGGGVCLSRCQPGIDPRARCGSPDLTCSRLYVGEGFFGGPELCLPRCNPQNGNSDCQNGLTLCRVGDEAESCLPENAVCTVTGCDDDGCSGGCDQAGAPCGGDEVCGASTIGGRCGADEVLVCRGPPALNEPCDLLGVPCADELACMPDTATTGRCAQQASPATAVVDGGACETVQDANPCQPGSFCAAPDGFLGPVRAGTCLPLCDAAHPCADDRLFCRSDRIQFAPELEVCVPGCSFDAAVGPVCPVVGPGLVCDILSDTGCAGAGFCSLRFDTNVQPTFCATNDACDPGGVCNASSTCQRIEQACP